MRLPVLAILILVSLTCSSLAAQEGASAASPASLPAVAGPKRVPPWGQESTLPPALVPADEAQPETIVAAARASEARSGAAPVLAGLAGAVVGAFVGSWAMRRNCEENCGEAGFYGLLGGAVIGWSVGWVVAGGPLPRR